MNTVSPLKIGQLLIKPPLILAPMAGVTGKALRKLVHELNFGSCGLYYTEFASVEGLVRKNKPTLRLIEKSAIDCESPFAIQLYGISPTNMALAAQIAVEHGADIVDINAGCPAQKVVKKGGGADLLKKPLLIGEIVQSVKKVVSVPVTVKIRIGWDEKSINMEEVIRIIEQAGADCITIHGRTRNQGFKDEADWDKIKRAKELLAIPVVGNGDISDISSFESRFYPSGVNAVMIGRGILRDPWIFRRLHCHLAGNLFVEPSVDEKFAMVKRFADLLAEDGLPPNAVIGQLKQLIVRFLRAKPNSAQHRTAALRSNALPQFFEAIRSYLFWDL